MGTIKVYTLAKELGVKSSDIIKKCQFEEKRLVAVKNHMSPITGDVAATIRTWFAKRTDELDDYICTIQFPFTINKSFVNVSTHPITIPQEYNSVLKEHISCDHYEIKLWISNYITIRGYIYYGISSWGPYYQIKIPKQEYSSISKNYRLGQQIEVELKISKPSIKVYLKETE